MATSLKLPARLEGVGKRLVATEPELLARVVEAFGSPCHFVFPEEFGHRIDAFKRAFRSAGVRGLVYYAAKANKSEAFLEIAARSGIGVDVASREEMAAALAAGIRGSNLMVTGPDKGPSLHRLTLRHGGCIALDSLEELQSLTRLVRENAGQRARVVLRYRPARESCSRFGMTEQEILTALQVILGESARIDLEGFSVHLNGYDIPARARAGAKLVRLCLAARRIGLRPSLIDLGGGWPVRYVGEPDWRNFEQNASPVHFHGKRRFDHFYPYHSAPAGHAALLHCLKAPSRQGESLADLCNRHDLSVAVEPGRALLDQAGLSAFRVKSVKARREGYSIITIEGQSFSLSEQWFGSEFLPDPVLVPSGPRPANPSRACVAGSSCLDSDMLTWRKIEFPMLPASGDLLVYCNTAGYQMDSNESPFHRTALPKKVAAWTGEPHLRWCSDRLFHQVGSTCLHTDYHKGSRYDHFADHGLDRLHATA